MQLQLRERRRLDFSKIGVLPPSTESLVKMVFLFLRGGVLVDMEMEAPMMRLLCRSFVDDGVFAREFFRMPSLRSLRLHFEKWLPRARAAGDVVLNSIPTPNLFWFVQHVATASCLVRLPRRPIMASEGSMDAVVRDMTIFALRGIGLTRTAIARYATEKRFRSWLAEGMG